MNLIESLPAETFALSSEKVPVFMGELRQKYDISITASAIAEEVLLHCYAQFGGYDEPATNHGVFGLPYHNGSHAAYVMAVAAHLGYGSGASQLQRDSLVIAGAGHDYLHRSTKPGEDEVASASAIAARLRVSPLRTLASIVPRLILSTTVDRIDRTDIYQRAIVIRSHFAQCLADADLAAFAAPNAGDWAMRLYEEENPQQRAKATARHFLEQTVYYQRNHRFVSELGRELLTPLAHCEADRLEARIPELIKQIKT